jgi:hypothetical protein
MREHYQWPYEQSYDEARQRTEDVLNFSEKTQGEWAEDHRIAPVQLRKFIARKRPSPPQGLVEALGLTTAGERVTDPEGWARKRQKWMDEAWRLLVARPVNSRSIVDQALFLETETGSPAELLIPGLVELAKRESVQPTPRRRTGHGNQHSPRRS